MPTFSAASATRSQSARARSQCCRASGKAYICSAARAARNRGRSARSLSWAANQWHATSLHARRRPRRTARATRRAARRTARAGACARPGAGRRTRPRRRARAGTSSGRLRSRAPGARRSAEGLAVELGSRGPRTAPSRKLCGTRLPMTAATRRNFARRRRRARRCGPARGRAKVGGKGPASAPAASISSVKNGLPSDRLKTASTMSSSGSAENPGDHRGNLVAAARSEELPRQASTRPLRSSSARTRRNGWRRWSSSLR